MSNNKNVKFNVKVNIRLVSGMLIDDVMTFTTEEEANAEAERVREMYLNANGGIFMWGNVVTVVENICAVTARVKIKCSDGYVNTINHINKLLSYGNPDDIIYKLCVRVYTKSEYDYYKEKLYFKTKEEAEAAYAVIVNDAFADRSAGRKIRIGNTITLSNYSTAMDAKIKPCIIPDPDDYQ